MFRRQRTQKQSPNRVGHRDLKFETLERRVVLTASAVFDNGLLTVTGDDNANTISILGQDVSGTSYLMVQDNGTTIFDGTPTGQNVAVSALQTVTASGGLGNDTLDLTSVSLANGFSGVTGVTLSGGGGDDTILGSALADNLLGDAGEDVLIGGTGNDTLDGGTDQDVYYFSGLQLGSDSIAAISDGIGDMLHFGDFGAAATVNLSSTSLQTVNTGNLQLTLGSSAAIQFVIDSPYSDTIVGNALDNSFLLSGGDDAVSGGAGNDLYSFAAANNGADTLTELNGEGQDWLDFASSASPLTLFLESAATQQWGAGAITLTNPEYFEHALGTAFDDFICGNDAGNYLFGDAGSDTLFGHGGADFLNGDLGDDQLGGGDADDALIGGAGIDNISGDLGNDLLVAADYDLSALAIETIQDLAGVIDPIMAAWTASIPVAERVANIMGAPGANNPLSSELQFQPGESLLDDAAADALLPLAGGDVAFLDSRSDYLVTASPNDATYIEIDPTWNPLEATFANGTLTVSYRGTGDLVYSVSGGYLLVNGQHVLGTPLAAGDVIQVVSQLGQLAKELDDAVLFSGALPNLDTSVWTRSDPLSAPVYTTTLIDDAMTAQVGPDWESLTSYTAQDIADACNAGNYDLMWQVLCASRMSESASFGAGWSGGSSAMIGGPLQLAPAKPLTWSDIADGIAMGDLSILSEYQSGGGGGGGMSAMSSGSGGEGGTLDVQDTTVTEGWYAQFVIEFNAEYFDGCSVNWHTEDQTAQGGESNCYDYKTSGGPLRWLDGREGDAGVSVLTYQNYVVDSPNKTFKVVLGDMVNDVGFNNDHHEGHMEIGTSGTATINNTTTLPSASVAGASEYEGHVLRFPVTLNQVYGETVVVNWSTQNITTEGSEDFSPISGTLTFLPRICSFAGQTLAYVEIAALVDLYIEGSESFKLVITAGSNVLVPAGGSEATGVISDPGQPDIDTDSNNNGVIEGSDDPIEMDDPGKMIVIHDTDNADTPVSQKDLALIALGVSTVGYTAEEINFASVELTADAGGNRIRLWLDPQGQTQVNLGTSWDLSSYPLFLYAEGIDEGQVVLTWTLYVNDIATGLDQIKLTVLSGDLTGYRPQTPRIDFNGDSHPVPDDIEITDGVGIRRNTDDDNNNTTADWREYGASQNEDDLIRLRWNNLAGSIPNVEYVLRVSSDSLAVWSDESKTQYLPIVGYRAYYDDATFSAVVSSTDSTMWVEWTGRPEFGPQAVSIWARDTRNNHEVLLDSVEFYPFNGIVVGMLGEDFGSGNPPDSGVLRLVER